MASTPIFTLESAPGDSPRTVEQPNGDLLLPAAVRPAIAKALLNADGVSPQVLKLLGIEKPVEVPTVVANLLKVRPI